MSVQHQNLPACACCMALAQVRMPVAYDPNLVVEHQHQPKPSKKKSKSILELFKGTPSKKAEQAEEGKESVEEEWDEQLHGPKPRKLWQGLDGMAVTVFGMVLPLLSLSFMCLSVPKRLTLVLLNHPIETLIEMALIAVLPIINYFVWLGLCKNRVRFTRTSAAGLGLAIGSAIFVSSVCIAAMFMAGDQLRDEIGTDFTSGFSWISLLSLLAAAASTFIIIRLRESREFASTKRQVVAFSVTGAVLSLFAFAAAEARPWYTQYVQHMAVSANKEEAKKGLALLRQLNPERELRMECSDVRAAGIAGLFLPVKQNSEHDLYFALTGKPYSYREYNNQDLSQMPDDYLSRNVVGDPISGLELSRSTLTGAVHPRTLSASMQWTFVFKNDTTQAQEARAELALPPGAVVTGLTRWENGEPEDATIVASGKAENGAGWQAAGHDSTGMVTDLGHGRLLLHCYPITSGGQAKVKVSMVVPLKPDTTTVAQVPLPEFVTANFSLAGEHQLRLQSNQHMASSDKNFREEASGDQYILSGSLTEEAIRKPKLEIRVAHDPHANIAAFDKNAVEFAVQEEKLAEAAAHREQHDTYDSQIFLVFDSNISSEEETKQIRRAFARRSNETVITKIPPHYITPSVEPVSAAAPSRLVVVVDGSATTAQHTEEIATALANLPRGIPVKMMFASTENVAATNPVSLADGLRFLKSGQFIGGQNNLKTVVRAAELAGETKNGAVLWIHGPQPASVQDIYIMSQYVALPKFYEVALGGGDVDTVEFFKNHPEVGPFVQVPVEGKSVAKDMLSFFARWTQQSSSYATRYSEVTKKPRSSTMLAGEESHEMLVLHANQRCRDMLSKKQYDKAARLATRYGFVSPVSCALLQTNTPHLQGATNGTIGPQGSDATVIYGVNTAGTVRVNNLANLEALLNIIANLGEVLFGLGGLILLIHGACKGSITAEVMGEEVEITAAQRITCGILMIVIGLAAPGLINWFVASARDANLFS